MNLRKIWFQNLEALKPASPDTSPPKSCSYAEHSAMKTDPHLWAVMTHVSAKSTTGCQFRACDKCKWTLAKWMAQ